MRHYTVVFTDSSGNRGSWHTVAKSKAAAREQWESKFSGVWFSVLWIAGDD